MPTSLSRLSSCLSSILSFLECPICFEIISPPAHQCPFGHLICFRCRVCIERCPVCRTNFTRERSLLADQIYNSVIEAFHLKEHSTSERTIKLWERVFGRRKKRDRGSNSNASTPKTSRASELKNKFLTRLIGKATSVDNLTSESSFTPNLRKKSISSTDIYPESLKRLNYLHESYLCSSDSSLPNQNSCTLSRYSSTTSCDALGSRNLPYYNRLRNRNLKDNNENLFQFSSEPNTDTAADSTHQYHCPLSETCAPLTAFSLLTHLQQHDGPVIQFFNSRLTINFPFSFENGAIVIVHCYEKTFFLRLLLDEVGDIKLCVWLLGPKNEADVFRLKVNVRATDSRSGDLKFETIVYSIQSTEPTNEIYKYRIVIANSTLQIYFQDRPYSLDLHFERVEDA